MNNPKVTNKCTAKKHDNLSGRLVLMAATCSAIALVSTMAAFAANAATIYRIVNNPAVQNGYTLSGTITTDGRSGSIYASNVLAWSFSVSNGIDTYSADSSQPGSSVSVDGILATSDYLELPSSTVSAPYGFAIFGATSHVQWTGSTLQDNSFTSASEWNGSWPWWQDRIITTPHDVPGGWAIADSGAPVPKAPTTYRIVNNPAVQNGYTLSGTITTDGRSGSIYASNVLAWSFLVSNGANTYSANSSQLGSSVSVEGILATPDYLELPSSTVSAPYGFSISGTTSHVQWTGSTLQNNSFTSASEWTGSWPWWQDRIITTPHDVPGGWAIADSGTPVPIVNLRKAVYVDSSNLKIGANYQLQFSTDLNTWTNSGTAFTATNSTWRSTHYWDVDSWSQFFFRLQIIP